MTARTTNATAANVRRGHLSAARRLADAGWYPIPPEALAALTPEVRQQIRDAIATTDAPVPPTDGPAAP